MFRLAMGAVTLLSHRRRDTKSFSSREDAFWGSALRSHIFHN